MKNLQGFRKRMLISSAFFILIVTLLCLGVVYYWSFFHFSHLFEDRVIDQLTFQKNQDMGIKNEWILGVTTDSIDVVEGIHGAKVAQQIQEHAHEQEEVKELYRETIDEKHLLYTIELNTILYYQRYLYRDFSSNSCLPVCICNYYCWNIVHIFQ